MGKVGVGFDIDHTLCIDNKLERVAFLHLLDRIVAEGGRTLGTLAQEIVHIDDLLAFQRSGGCSVDDAVARFVTERGARAYADHADGFKRMSLAMAETFIVPDPEAKGTVDELVRRGVPMAVLSNGWNPLQHLKARRAGFPGRVLASGDLGVQKPNIEAFQALAAALEFPPERCFYVGDDPKSDIMGAMNAGFRAVWLDNEGKTYPSDLPPPHYVIQTLGGVLDVIATAVPL